MGRRALTRYPLFAVILGAAAVSIALIYCAFHYKDIDSFKVVLYAAIALQAIYTLAVLLAAVSRASLLRAISVAALLGGLSGSLLLLAMDFAQQLNLQSMYHVHSRWSHAIWPVVTLCWLVGSVSTLVGLVWGVRLNGRYSLVRWVTIIPLLALSVLIASWSVGPTPILFDEIKTTKAMMIFGAVSGLGLFTTLLLARVSQLENRSQLQCELSEIRIHCPRCLTEQLIGLGKSACAQCQLKFEISLTENLCTKCGYSLYLLESSTCPECGTPVLQKAPAANEPV